MAARPIHLPGPLPYRGAMKTKPDTTPEALLTQQLSACLAAMQDCLVHSRASRDDDSLGHLRRNDIAYMAKLMKASARLSESLGRLKGQTRHDIHVTRQTAHDGNATGMDKGEG